MGGWWGNGQSGAVRSRALGALIAGGGSAPFRPPMRTGMRHLVSTGLDAAAPLPERHEHLDRGPQEPHEAKKKALIHGQILPGCLGGGWRSESAVVPRERGLVTPVAAG